MMSQYEQHFYESATRFFRECTNADDRADKRYEIARTMMGAAYKEGVSPEVLAKYAVECADALIAELEK